MINKKLICPKCKKLKIETSQGYCKDCHNEYSKSVAKILNSRHFIYILFAGGKAMYIGSSKSMNRVGVHLNGHSHLKISPQEWLEMGFDEVMLIDLTHVFIIEDDMSERAFLERLFLLHYSPVLNKNFPKDKINSEEKAELLKKRFSERQVLYRNNIQPNISDKGKLKFNYRDCRIN